MEFAFASKKIRHLCESESKAKHFFGENISKKLKHRLLDIEAASSLADMRAVWPHISEGDKTGGWFLDLCDGYKIRFTVPNNNSTSTPETIDWEKVTRILIINIEKYG